MAVCTGRSAAIGFFSSRSGRCLGLAALLLLVGSQSRDQANAIGDTRTIAFHHVHTNEDLTITYKRNGRYDETALQQINHLLRDWRRNEQVKMDPQLIDLLWEIHREVGSKAPIYVICGYRAPETNAMLRARSSGVALYSQHMAGTATDFFIPGVPLYQLRAVAMRLQSGGVGYYPASGSHFVHVDTANVRHWPRMTREELVRLFPDQRTLHIPSDGQPLAGYALALADHSRGLKSPPTKFTLLAKATDEEEDVNTGATHRVAMPMPMARPADLVAAVAKVIPQKAPQPTALALASNRPPELTTMAPASTMPAPKAKLATARAVSPASIFLPWPAPPKVDRVSPEVAMAYAAINEPAPLMELGNVQRPQFLSRSGVQSPSPAVNVGAVPVKTPAAAARPIAGSPWLRAVVLAPNMYQYMAATPFSPPDKRQFVMFMQKPRSVLMMGFSSDPYSGMTTTAFTGKAVQFLATVDFGGVRTAALR